MEPRLDPPNTELEENMYDKVGDMHIVEVVEELHKRNRLPSKVDAAIRECLEEILIEEWRYPE